jgi:hypothetical protein
VGEPATRDALGAYARSHGVSAEVRPHYDVWDHRCVQTGFDLTLLTARPAGCSGDPGCTECERTHAALRDIALAVLPPGWGHAVEPFEAAFHYRPETRWRPEIETVVEMLPPGPSPGSVGASASAALAAVRRGLHDLGVGDQFRPPLAA